MPDSPDEGLRRTGHGRRKLHREISLLLAWGPAILLQLAHPLVARGSPTTARFTPSAGPGAAPPPDPRRDAAALFRHRARSPGRGGADQRHPRPRAWPAARDRGIFPAGTPYSARDPALLAWVHATLLDMNLRVYELSCLRSPSRRRTVTVRGQRDRRAPRHSRRTSPAEGQSSPAVHGHDARERGDQRERRRADTRARARVSSGAWCRRACLLAHPPHHHRSPAADDPSRLWLLPGPRGGGHAQAVGGARLQAATADAVHPSPLAGGAHRPRGGEPIRLSDRHVIRPPLLMRSSASPGAAIVSVVSSTSRKDRPHRSVNVLTRLLYRVYEQRLLRHVAPGPIPHHLGLIQDGHRRYAREAGLSNLSGYRHKSDQGGGSSDLVCPPVGNPDGHSLVALDPKTSAVTLATLPRFST